MADLSVTGSSTYTAGPIDTYTALSNGNNGSEILAEHIMGALDAITKVESALGTGNALKGNKSTLAARLDQMISADGGVGNGTAFPSSQTPVNGQLFFRTDLKQLYIYDSALASWSRIDGVNDHGLLGGLADDDHSQYLNTARHDLVARHGKSVLPSEVVYADVITALVNKGFVVSGFTFPASSVNLSFNVAAGVTFFFGYRVEIDTATAINCTDNITNFAFLKLLRDGGGNVIGAAFETNTTGTPPAESIAIATATAIGGQLISISDSRPFNPIAFKDGNLTINGTISFSSVAAGLLPFALIGYNLLQTTQNFGSIAAGTTASVTLALTGAAFGDFVWVSCSAAIPTGLIVHAYVESAGNVKLCLSNVSAGAIDPASITFNIRLYR